MFEKCIVCGDTYKYNTHEYIKYTPKVCDKKCLEIFLKQQDMYYIPLSKNFNDNLGYGDISSEIEFDESVFRSNGEYKLALWMKHKKINWVYEPYYFTLPSGKVYIPDFVLPDSNTIIEFKGIWKEKGKNKNTGRVDKFKEFFEIYDKYRIVLVTSDFWKRLK